MGSFNHQSSWDRPRTYIRYTTERLVHLRVSQVEDAAESILVQLYLHNMKRPLIRSDGELVL